MSTKATILDLNEDILIIIFEDICNTYWLRDRKGEVPYNRARKLLSLSSTCRQMRELILPRVFREVYNFPGALWPRNLWKYFK